MQSHHSPQTHLPGTVTGAPLNGTGDGTPHNCRWTPTDRLNLVVALGLIGIVVLIICALMIVRQEEIRTILATMAATGIGALSGVLRVGQSHNTQGVSAGNVETVEVQPPPPALGNQP